MKLKEIAAIRTGLVLSRKKASSYDDVKKCYKQITLKAFSGTTSLIQKYLDEFIANKEIHDDYISQVSDIVVRLREPNTAVYIDQSTKGMIIPSLMGIVIVKDDAAIDKEFLAYYLNSTTVKKALQIKVKGTTIPMIKTKDLEDIEITLPSLTQQKKIVEFLKLSQKEISLLEQLKEQKKHFASNVLDNIIEKTKEDN